MASYTDESLKFNPYVSQLPVEAMVKVGMYKQQKYDEGVQKIQGYIDNIAGMDVARDVDKQYLQSKLNELGNSLKYVAGGDFSNQQLVNSVGGMATQIGKDANVQNAVSSTAWYRKQMEQIRKDEEEGKSNPANTDDFNEKANGWLSSTKAGERFGGSYIKPIDVWAKIKEIGASVGLDEKTVQELYKTDEQGNRLYKDIKDPKTGKVLGKEPEWNPVMVEKHLKGKDAGKILSAFQNALTPADYQQLAITGKYVRKGYTPEMLISEIKTNTSGQIDSASAKIDAVKLALYQEEQKNVKDDVKITSLKTQLDYFTKAKSSLESSRDKDIALATTNPNAVKASLYTNSYLSNMSKALSSADEDTKYSISPLWTITMDQNRFNREIQRDKIADYHWSVEQERADKKLEYEKEQGALELYYKYGVKTPGLKLPPGATGVGDFVKGPIKLEGNESMIKNAVEDSYSNTLTNLNDVNYKLTAEYFKAISPKEAGETDGEYNERINKKIYNAASQNKEIVDVSSGAINSFTARFAGKQLGEWKTNPSKIPFEFRGLISKQDELSKDVVVQQSRINDIKKQAIEIGKSKGLNLPTDAEIRKNIKPSTVTLNDGSQVTLTSDDIINFVESAPSVFNVFGNTFTAKEQEQKARQANLKLKAKFGDTNYNKLVSSLFTIGEGVTLANPVIESAAGFLKNSNYKQLAKIESQLYLDKGMIKQPLTAPVLRGKENREDKNSRISAIIDKYKGNLNETPGFNESDMQTALLSDNENAVLVRATPGLTAHDATTYNLIINTKDGKSREATIDADDYEYITGNRFENKALPKILEKINYDGTSNTSKSIDPKSAWWGKDDFKNLKGVENISADLITDQYDKNKLWMKLYIDGSPLTYPTPFYKYNQDGTINNNLDYLPLGINSTVIKQIKSIN
jgi:hypothetical protein